MTESEQFRLLQALLCAFAAGFPVLAGIAMLMWSYAHCGDNLDDEDFPP